MRRSSLAHSLRMKFRSSGSSPKLLTCPRCRTTARSTNTTCSAGLDPGDIRAMQTTFPGSSDRNLSEDCRIFQLSGIRKSVDLKIIQPSPFYAQNVRSSVRYRMASAICLGSIPAPLSRSEEHTSELQSLTNLVCRLLLEKK